MSDLIAEWLDILSDPGHLLAEATFVTAEILLLTPLVRWLHGRWVKRHDQHHHPKSRWHEVADDLHERQLAATQQHGYPRTGFH